MKLIVALVLVLVTSLTSAQITPSSVALSIGQWLSKDSKKVYYVKVSGNGRNQEEARNMAFRKAIELAVGSLIVGETVTRDNRLIRNEIINYSSGYVDDFKIITETETTVVMDVWVSDSKIADRLKNMGESHSSAVDGELIQKDWARRSVQDKTDYQRTLDGQRLIKSIVMDYPLMALKVTVNNTRMTRVDNKLVLEIQSQVDFTKEYSGSLSEAMLLTRNATMSGRYDEDVQLERGWFDFTFAYWLDGSIRQQLIDMSKKPVSVEVNFGNGHRACWDFENIANGKFYRWSTTKTFVINTRPSLKVNLQLENPGMSEFEYVNWVRGINNIEARVIDTKYCPQ